MHILKRFIELLSYRENLDREGFILKETIDDKEDRTSNNDKQEGRRPFRKPRHAPDMAKGEHAQDSRAVSAYLKENKKALNRMYGLPGNKDVVIRDFIIGTNPAIECFSVFIDGMTDTAVQDLLFQALMAFAGRPAPADKGNIAKMVKNNLLPGNQVTIQSHFRDVLDAVNYGDTAIFFEGCAEVALVETKGWEHRGVDRPVSEQTVLGPQEAFNETLRSNTALLRKLIRSEKLSTEFIKVGMRNETYVAVMYLRDLANPALVAEVKRRINSIKVDHILDSGVLEQFIEDNPYNLNSTVLATERPDRIASKIVEGRVAILVDGSPFVLVVPTTMYEQLHTGEESYSRWQFGTFIRYLRVFAFGLSFLLPGLYLAIVLFHHEMIPTELLLAIAGNREKVPFPSIVEVLLMELSFELIREAGLRIPGIMGSTIGIIGALILGQAAVQANIVSPILVILVAVTGLASFAIPYYSLAFTARIYRFIYIALGVTLGFFGISMGLFAQIILTANLKSFGAPYLAPTGPRTVAGGDIVTRLPVFFHERRPDYVNPQDITRQPEISRGWTRQNGGEKSD